MSYILEAKDIQKSYVLEVQKVTNREQNTPHNVYGWIKKSESQGYMKKIFKTQQEACDYYDKYNPHMRSLNEHKNWCSDMDPNSGLMYIVREHFYEELKIESFEYYLF
jgi:arylamine N-acetyltransferase